MQTHHELFEPLNVKLKVPTFSNYFFKNSQTRRLCTSITLKVQIIWRLVVKPINLRYCPSQTRSYQYYPSIFNSQYFSSHINVNLLRKWYCQIYLPFYLPVAWSIRKYSYTPNSIYCSRENKQDQKQSKVKTLLSSVDLEYVKKVTLNPRTHCCTLSP